MKHLLLIIICTVRTSTIFAQSLTSELIASAGTSFSSASSKIEFTIGEVAISTLTSGIFFRI